MQRCQINWSLLHELPTPTDRWNSFFWLHQKFHFIFLCVSFLSAKCWNLSFRTMQHNVNVWKQSKIKELNFIRVFFYIMTVSSVELQTISYRAINERKSIKHWKQWRNYESLYMNNLVQSTAVMIIKLMLKTFVDFCLLKNIKFLN